MTPEQEIENLKIQVAQLFGMVMAAQDAEIQVPVCGPNIRKEVFTSDNPTQNRIISFGCTYTGLVITMRLGRYYFKGVPKTISSWPAAGEVTVSATTYGYVSIDLTSGDASFQTGATDPGAGDDDTENCLIFIATVAGGIITELEECQHSDIRSWGNA